MTKKLSRRNLLLGGAAALGATTLHVPFGFARRAATPPGPVLVTVFLRGGMDSLGVVAPAKDKEYQSLRPDIALPPAPRRDSESAESMRLDRTFSIHAGMRPLMKHRDNLAVVVAAGLPTAIRSHFTAQYVVEHGAPTSQDALDSGWVARLSHQLPKAPVVEMGNALPHSLSGSEAIAINSGRVRKVQPRLEKIIEGLYTSGSSDSDLISRTRQVGARGLQMQEQLLGISSLPAGVSKQFGKNKLAKGLRMASRLITDSNPQLITISHGSWDSHRNQKGMLNNRVKELGTALAGFWESLGGHQRRVVVLVMSEFGRTAKQNGTQGTDHGWGTAMFVLGKKVRGGVHGKWPGLRPDQLFEGRDLAVTTDYRRVLGTVTQKHLNIAPSQIDLPVETLSLFRA